MLASGSWARVKKREPFTGPSLYKSPGVSPLTPGDSALEQQAAAMPGKYYEDLEPGMTFRHSLGRTITEADNVLFCSLTMNTQPLHLNEDFASKTQFGRRIVNGLLTMSLVVGMSVTDLTDGTIIANLGYENIKHPSPSFTAIQSMSKRRLFPSARASRARTAAS